jgi:hypothetical protein
LQVASDGFANCFSNISDCKKPNCFSLDFQTFLTFSVK